MMLRIICADIYNDVAHYLFDLETPANVQAANWFGAKGPSEGQLTCRRAPKGFAICSLMTRCGTLLTSGVPPKDLLH